MHLATKSPPALYHRLQSREELRILCNPDEPLEMRTAALDSMLNRTSGWWGDGHLLSHVRRLSRRVAARTATRYGMPVDVVDWEGIAQDAVLALFHGGNRVVDSHANWLHGLIENLVRNEIRQSFKRLESDSIFHYRAAHQPPSPESETAVADECLSNDILRAAIASLPRGLRELASLVFLEGLTRAEVERRLSITRANVRVRIKRTLDRLRGSTRPASRAAGMRRSHAASPERVAAG
jgi:RNA polymerase sigma factor (sigma-70 family)